MNWLSAFLSALGMGTNVVSRPIECPNRGAIYGIVNFGWYSMSDKQLDAYMKSLHDNGWLGTIVELRGPWAWSNEPGAKTPEEMLKKLERLLDAADKYDLWVWVIDCNFNAPYIRAPYEQLHAYAMKVVSLVGGYDRILMQGASEVASTKVDHGAHMQKGLQLMEFYQSALGNRATHVWYMYSAMAKVPAWADVADWHISGLSAGSTVPKKINTLNTDHSTILATMLGGNREGQKWDLPDVTALWNRAKVENKLMVLYHFYGRAPDYNCIRHGKVMWGKNGSWR